MDSFPLGTSRALQILRVDNYEAIKWQFIVSHWIILIIKREHAVAVILLHCEVSL